MTSNGIVEAVQCAFQRKTFSPNEHFRRIRDYSDHTANP